MKVKHCPCRLTQCPVGSFLTCQYSSCSWSILKAQGVILNKTRARASKDHKVGTASVWPGTEENPTYSRRVYPTRGKILPAHLYAITSFAFQNCQGQLIYQFSYNFVFKTPTSAVLSGSLDNNDDRPCL